MGNDAIMTYKKDQEILDIEEPPCRYCKHWTPQRKYRTVPGVGVIYDGLMLCSAEDMYHDFSCYQSKQLRPQSSGVTRLPAGG